VVQEVKAGIPFQEIVSDARKRDVDLLVMGTHGRTFLKYALIGSVAAKVVRKAPCPVLTVRHPKHKFQMPWAPVLSMTSTPATTIGGKAG
jgi:nucleotide-binding universal stress UspA family protein